jgi:hypothetical protein
MPCEDCVFWEIKDGLDDRCEGGLNNGIKWTLCTPIARKHTEADSFARSSDDDREVDLPWGRSTTL